MNRCTTICSLILSATGLTLAHSAEWGDAAKVDVELEEVKKNSHSYMFVDQANDLVDKHKFIKIHSVASTSNGQKYVELRPGTVRYFRTDGTVAASGKHAEISWSIGDKNKTTQVGEPGGVVMVVRSLAGEVSWYSMKLDLRC